MTLYVFIVLSKSSQLGAFRSEIWIEGIPIDVNVKQESTSIIFHNNYINLKPLPWLSLLFSANYNWYYRKCFPAVTLQLEVYRELRSTKIHHFCRYCLSKIQLIYVILHLQKCDLELTPIATDVYEICIMKPLFWQDSSLFLTK